MFFCACFCQEAENAVASKVKELAKSRTECAEKEATIAAMKIDIQTLNKAIEDAKNKVQNSEEEVRRLQVTSLSYQLYSLSECKGVVCSLRPSILPWVRRDHKLSHNKRGWGWGKTLSRSALVSLELSKKNNP